MNIFILQCDPVNLFITRTQEYPFSKFAKDLLLTYFYTGYLVHLLKIMFFTIGPGIVHDKFIFRHNVSHLREKISDVYIIEIADAIKS